MVISRLIVAIALAGFTIGCSKTQTQKPVAQTSTAAPAAKRYHLTGKVVAVDKTAGNLTVDAEAIPGFMGAMAMAYTAKPASQVDKLSPGDSITADVVDTGESYWLENITVIRHGRTLASREINLPLTLVAHSKLLECATMPQEPLTIEDLAGPQDGQRILRLTGPLLLTNLFDFQAKVRGNTAPKLILDFTAVPYIDSAGIGALVGAYVTHQKDGRSLALVGVGDRVQTALRVTHVDQFFTFFKNAADAERAIA